MTRKVQQNYDNTTMAGKGIRLSDLPVDIHRSIGNLVREFDTDGDGVIDANELAAAGQALRQSRKKNSLLKKMVIGLVVASVLLIGAIFSTSVVASYIVKDTETGRDGILRMKGSYIAVKTAEAISWKETSVVDMSIDELNELKYFTISSDNIVTSFNIKGYQKVIDKNSVSLLVEGGTIEFDKDGISGSTGAALSYLGAAVNESGKRRLGGGHDSMMGGSSLGK